MPVNYIQLSTASTLGTYLQGTASSLSGILGRLTQIKADMDNMTDGVTFATLEAAFGIPTGKGQSVYNLIAGAVADTNASTNIQNLMNWLGVTR